MKIKVTYDYDPSLQQGRRFQAKTSFRSNEHNAYAWVDLFASSTDYHAAKAALIEQVKDYLARPADEEVEINVD